MKLKDGDHILTAYAEPASGPGWRNSPIWVIVQERGGRIRQECIQPVDQSGDMIYCYPFSAVAHGEMTAAVRRDCRSES